MDTLSIILLYSVAILFLCIILPLFGFRNTFLKWTLKLFLIICVSVICFRYIQDVSYVEPYVPDNNPTVYVTNTGDCYHEDGCRYLRSRNRTTLYDAYLDKYRSCSICDPPELSKLDKRRIDESLERNTPAVDEFLMSKEYICLGICVAVLLWLILHFKFDDKLCTLGYSYVTSVLYHSMFLYGIFFLPAAISAFIIIYSLIGAILLLYAICSSVFSFLLRPFTRKETIIVKKISHDPEPEVIPVDEKVYYMESADDMLVRVPEDKLDAWQAAQESHGPVPSPEMKKLFREEITKRIYGTPSDKE